MYYSATGTSLSAPQVAGALALLLSANPSLSADRQDAILMNAAVDLGSKGPDNEFGYGRLDAIRAHALLQTYGLHLPLASRAGPGS